MEMTMAMNGTSGIDLGPDDEFYRDAPEQAAQDEGDGPGLTVTAAEFDIARHDAKITLISPRSGEHRTFRVRTIRNGDLAGARVVELLNGPDNTASYQPFAFVSDGRHGTTCPMGTVCVWRRFRGEQEPSIYERYADLLNRAAYWAARGVEFKLSLKCRRCGRDLTHPGSLTDGMGPICREKAALGI
jgi:hypothetical protein